VNILPAALTLALAPAWAIRPETDRLILQGLDAAYGFDFERAASLFSKADQAEPDHPAGPFFLASLKWLEFSQNADIPGSLKALEPQFNRLLEETFERSRRMREKSPEDPEAFFYLGGAYGMRGRWQLLKRQWIRAASSGYKGYRQLKKAVELDPSFYDAYLGLGMYDYYAAKLPAVIKLAALLVARGDKERGLSHVLLAIEKGHYSVTEAKLFLVGIYTGYEKQPQKALQIIQELRRQKPENLFFTFMEVVARIDSQDWMGAIAYGEELLPKAREASYTRPQLSLIELYLGEAYLGAKDYEKAVETFTRCIEQAPEPRKATVTYCYLRRAQALDLLGRREEALRDYRLAEERPDFFDSQDKARKGLKREATHDEVLRQLLE